MSEKQISTSSSDSNAVLNELTLRSSHPCGTESQIVCNPGQVTVLGSRADMEEIRTALLEWRQLEGVSIQYGTEPLSSKDVFTISNDQNIEHPTPLTELTSWGVEAEIAFNLLSAIGLEKKAAAKMEDLTSLEIWRLRALCAQKSKSSVNHFDFYGVDLPEQAREMLCEQIRKGSQEDGKIVIVTSLREVPKCWRNASNVVVQGTGKAGELLLGSREQFLAKKEEAESDNVSPAPAKILNETQLKMEAIPNLNLDDEEPTIQIAKRKTSSGKLTRVSGIKSIKLRLGTLIRKLFS